jgi:hypothetical protein
MQVPEGSEETLLHRVLDRLAPETHGAGDGMSLLDAPEDQGLEGLRLAGQGLPDQGGIGGGEQRRINSFTLHDPRATAGVP